ncbi:threonine-phosphate decarboxylase [Methylobacillus flagellatus]|uniref:threonine-phosphate decarboxylase CobD n=1 Tax=Methylobacillus flagellatus TaxID=405 RepID=UPI002853A409|nr:threonine-phosphate decarboxylase CobD [Methylobacillus flagellatus]MDR5172946.1 threonine-phosphate decarboxylase [Methylobacillus flagellatus]
MLEHGGNLHAASRQYGIAREDWLDLSTGINPHGYPVPDIPPSAWQRLPETDQQLERIAANYYGARHLLTTSGSQAAIQALPRLRGPCRVTVLGPMYAEHAHAWRQQGHQVNEIDNLPGANILAETDVLLACNPNNPTARLIAPGALLEWHQALSQHGGWLILDEAFMDSTPEHSLAAYSHQPGLIILRSLGKFFGLAGARVGFLLAEASLLDRVADLLGPWAVTGPARIVAQAALADHSWRQHNRARLLAESQQLADMLQQSGLPPLNGCALFQWLRVEHAEHLHAQLAHQGVWTRHFPARQGVRIGLPPADGWQKLAAALANLHI